MNENRRAKLKRLILKLPLGAQLLQLRRAMILRHKTKKRQATLCREEKKRIKIELQRKKRLKRNRKKICRKKEIIRQSVVIKHKELLLDEIKLHNENYYYNYSVRNLNIFRCYSQVLPEQATAFEIGAGRFLTAPIGLSLLGFKRVITVDIQRAKPEYVQTVYKYYRKHKKAFGFHHLPKIKQKFTDENLENILLDYFNIDYRAPYDAVHTDLPDNSVDYVFSQVTFEHIRAELLPNIVKELFRILRGGGGAPCYYRL